MAEVLARVRTELQDRLKEIEAELAGAEALMAEKARIEHALATPPFAEPARRSPRPTKARTPPGANRAAVESTPSEPPLPSAEPAPEVSTDDDTRAAEPSDAAAPSAEAAPLAPSDVAEPSDAEEPDDTPRLPAATVTV